MKGALSIKHLLLPALTGFATLTMAQKVTVSDCDLNGWQEFIQSEGTLSFVNGPANPPLGKGSLQFELGINGSKATIVNTSFSGTPLSDLTKLSYWTYVEHYLNGQAPALEFAIDRNADGIVDDGIVFEPIYQTGLYFGPVQNGGMVSLNTWQEWDALAGGWWTAHDGTAGPPTTTIALYLATFPEAEILAVSFNTGTGFTWIDFKGNADALKIAVNGKTTTYNFEPCAPCGDKNEKVVVCHDGNDICISHNAVQAHLDHGDELGSCSPTAIVNISKASEEVVNPAKFFLSNYPNPFGNVTRIQYGLPYNSKVSLKVFDVAGREIATLVDGNKTAGVHSVDFNAANFSNGVYYYKISAISKEQQFTHTQKMILLQ